MLALWCLMALPSRPYDAHSLTRPGNARFVAQIDAAFEWLGCPLPRATIGAALIDLTTPAVAARNAMVAPFERILAFAQTGQSWGLFLEKGRVAFRLQVDGRRADGAWDSIYRHHQHDPLGLARWLSFRRLRGIYNPGSKAPRAQYDGFVTWVARKILGEHPQYAGVRVSFERLQLGRGQEPSRLLTVEHVAERTREQVL